MLGAKLLDLASAIQASRVTLLMVTDTPLNPVGGLVDSGKMPSRQSAAVCLAPLWALIERCWSGQGHHERRPTIQKGTSHRRFNVVEQPLLEIFWQNHESTS